MKRCNSHPWFLSHHMAKCFSSCVYMNYIHLPAKTSKRTCHIESSGCIIYLALIISCAGMIGRLMETAVLLKKYNHMGRHQKCLFVQLSFEIMCSCTKAHSNCML